MAAPLSLVASARLTAATLLTCGNKSSSEFLSARRLFSTRPQLPGLTPEVPSSVVLYRGPLLRLVVAAVRTKVLQFAAMGVSLYPLAMLLEGNLSTHQTMLIAATVGGSALASATLWFYSRRYVGEMALFCPPGVPQGPPGARPPPRPTAVRFSVLDFWGRRENVDVDIGLIQPPFKGHTRAALARLAQLPFVLVPVAGHREFLISLRFGELRQRDILFDILYGRMEAAVAKGHALMRGPDQV